MEGNFWRRRCKLFSDRRRFCSTCSKNDKICFPLYNWMVGNYFQKCMTLMPIFCQWLSILEHLWNPKTEQNVFLTEFLSMEGMHTKQNTFLFAFGSQFSFSLKPEFVFLFRRKIHESKKQKNRCFFFKFLTTHEQNLIIKILKRKN